MQREYNVPSYLHNVFIPQQSVHRYCTRSSSQAVFATVPSHRQSLLQNGTVDDLKHNAITFRMMSSVQFLLTHVLFIYN